MKVIKKFKKKIDAIKRLKKAHEDLLAETDFYNYGGINPKTGENIYYTNDGNSRIDGGIIGNYKLSKDGIDYYNKKLEEYQAFDANKRIDLFNKVDEADSKKQLELIKQYIDAQENLNKLITEEKKLKNELTNAEESEIDTIKKQLKLNNQAQQRERDKLIDVQNNGLDVEQGTYTDVAGNVNRLTIENAQYLADEELRIERQKIEDKKKLKQQELKVQREKFSRTKRTKRSYK